MKRLCLAVAMSVAALFSSRADTTLVFNEIMYHPATNEPALEWVELYNQMAVDLDVGGWRITGDIGYTFPANARIAGRSFVVVAINPAAFMVATGQTNIVGPFTNRLSNSGGTLNLRNNNGRIVNAVDYGTEDEWPVAPDGAGVSLAKRDRDAGSDAAANWTVSEQVNGTPGTDNFPAIGASAVGLIPIGAVWKYEASGVDLGTGWSAANFSDGTWSSRSGLTNRAVPGLFNTGVDANGAVIADGGVDPHYILSYTAQGPVGANATVTLNHSAWLANDASSKWISVINPGTTSINGGGYGFQTTFSLAGFLPSTVRIDFNVAIDNALTNVFLNGVAADYSFTGFASFSTPFTLNSGFASGVNTLEFGTENQGAGPGAFRALVSGSGLSANTNSPLPGGLSTYYFRNTFNFSGNPNYSTLRLNPVLADGAVFYLNGVEVYRQNMPAGPISFSTPALSDVIAVNYSGPITISASNLVFGPNVLAVEVHQAAGSPDGPIFGTELSYIPSPVPPTTLTFNELSASTNGTFWVELMNYGTNPIVLDGMVIRHDSGATNHDYVIPSGVTLNAESFLVITNNSLGFLPESSDKLYLVASNRSAVFDGVVVKKGPRVRSLNGTGAWLVPNAATPGVPNSFALHNEIVINEIMYHHKLLPQVATNIPPQDNHEQWIELYNRSGNAVNLTGWGFTSGIEYKFASNKIIAAGGYLLVTPDAVALRAQYPVLDIVGDFSGNLSHASDRLVLSDDVGNPADEVHYFTSGRWPEYPDGGGTSLELRDPDADNSKAEAWAASDESAGSSWQTYSYRAVAAPSVTASPDAQWREFVFGLLSGGECLIDDINVVESPGGSAVAYVGNGNFENGLTGWRVLGTHVRSFVESEPGNPGNHVLHVIATGAQEHMHNHIETTILNNRIVNNGQNYEVSFRAKWLAGNSLLNTRLYFNRVARTTELIAPQFNGTPGARNSRYATNIGPTFAQLRHTPVAPQGNQPVTVSVVAHDPDGASSCQLFWSVNGGAFSSTAMTSVGGIYSGTIPGAAAATVVQFYVRATDGLGAVSTFPANGANSAALYKVFDGLANLPLAHNVRILMTPDNAALLHASTNVMSNDTLPCTVVYDERIVYYDVAIHLKSSERGRNDAARVGFHLVFQPDNLFRGEHPVMLVDRSPGGSRPAQEEIVLRHMVLRTGVPAVNADLIRVLAPMAAQNGPAIFAPRFEDEFVESAYENGGDGTLFELELIYYPTTANTAGYKLPQPDAVQELDYGNYGNAKETYRYNFIIKNHRGTDDYDQFMAFAKP
ncbi:MAG TPA: lamin tail domain-containing protein, partial [Candidatus Limnocylindria bacterium]|nr:lamin tail domain-containing protein [Candidatus Limnocylindria bacterium]